MNKVHAHPLDAGKTYFGRALEGGEVLQKGDMYSSFITGKWELVPTTFLGTPVQEGHPAALIRPAKCTSGESVSHDLVTKRITDPEEPHPVFERTTCSSCHRWLRDELVPA